MKNKLKCILIILGIAGLAGWVRSQTTRPGTSSDPSQATSPIRSPDFISISGDDDKWWEISELNNVASTYLWTNGMPKATNYHVRVNISPRDTNIMCRFYYMDPKGFGRPFWVAEFGYDGKVKTFAKKIASEGGFGTPFTVPKGARPVPADSKN